MEEPLKKIKAELEKEAPNAEAISEWLKQIVAASSKQPTGYSGKALVASAIGALGIGGAAGGGIESLKWDKLPRLELPYVNSYWTLMAIVSALGALVGLGHSFYRNNWTFLPFTWVKSERGYKVESWGFVLNMAMAAAVAIATTWMATSKEADVPGNSDKTATVSSDTPAPSAASEAEGAVKPEKLPANESPVTKSLLTWQVLLSAFVASLVGSRMASGETEKDVLWKALSTTAEMPPVPGATIEIEGAKTPFAAAAIARRLVPRLKATEDELLTLLNRDILKETIVKSGEPFTANNTSLTLESLEIFQPLRNGVKRILKDLGIADIAKLSREEFEVQMGQRGVETTNLKGVLDNIHNDVVSVMDLLRSLPPTWSLRSESL